METQKRKPTNKAERRARELADLAATSGWDRKVLPHIARKAEEAAARARAREDYRAGRRGGLDAVPDGPLSAEPMSTAQLAQTLSQRRARLPVDVKPSKAMVRALQENLRPFAAAVPPTSDDDDDDEGSDVQGGEDDGVLGRDEDQTDDATSDASSTTEDDDDDDDDERDELDEQTGATAAVAARLAGRKVKNRKTAHDVRVEEEKAKDFFDSLGVADKEMLARSVMNVLLGDHQAKLERRGGVLVRRSTGKRFGEMPTRENRLSLAATPSQKEQTRYESELWDFFNRCLTELAPGARKGLLEELEAADEERSRKHNRVGPLKNPFGEVDDDDAAKLDLWRPVGWRSGADLVRERAAQRLAQEKARQHQQQQKHASATGRPVLTAAQIAQQQRTSGVLDDLLGSAAAAAKKKE